MQKACSFPLVVLLVTILAVSTTRLAQSAGPLQVAAAVCRDVVNREPVDAGTNFPVSVGKLSCFTKVIGVEGSSKITHVWYLGDQERFRVDLAANGFTWRTFSTKAVRPGDAGSWRVDVVDPAGAVLKSVPFEVTPSRVTNRFTVATVPSAGVAPSLPSGCHPWQPSLSRPAGWLV